MNLPYLLQSKKTRSEYLLDLARLDLFFAPVVEDLCVLGFDLDFPLLGSGGVYRPKRIEVPSTDFEHDFVREVNRGRVRPHFSLNGLLGRDGCTHLWLHELVHFYQDLYGLFLEPLVVRGEEVVVADEESYVAAILFCEAMAQVEAVRASWRLREAGYAAPRRGGLKSEWSALLLLYEEVLVRDGEANAAAEIYEAWYGLAQRTYYEAQARSYYAAEMAGYDGRVVEVSLAQLVGLMPEGLQLPYAPKREAMPSDFQHGSAVCLWRQIRLEGSGYGV